MKKSNLLRTIILAASLLLQLGTLCSESRGAAGDVDLSFDPGSGVNGTVYAAVLQPDGKVLIGGHFSTVKGVASRGVARLNADGTGDSGFTTGESGYAVVSSSLALQSDGKVLVGHYYGIARLNSDGSLDTNFHATPTAIYEESIYAAAVNSVAVQPDGKVLIAGDFTSVNGTNRNRIARLNADGSVDSTFDPGTLANQRVNSVVLQPDGKVLIVGQFCIMIGTNWSCGIARLNSNGSRDGSFNPGAGAYGIASIALQPDGKMLVGGGQNIYINGHFGIARLNPDGSDDSSFNPGTGAYNISTIALQSDGKVLIGGEFTTVNGTNRNHIARLNSNGGLDSSFDPAIGVTGPIGSGTKVISVALQADGKLLIGGFFTGVNGTNRNNFARLNPDGGLDGSFDPGMGVNGGVSSLRLQPDGKVLIAGSFTTIKDFNRRGTARLHANGSGDGAFSPGAGYQVSSLALQSDGKVLIVGEGGLTRLNVDGNVDNSFVPDFGFATSYYDYSAPNAIALQSDGKVLVGGITYFCNFDVDLQVCAYSTESFLNRLNTNGSRDNSFNPPSTYAYSILQQPDGKVLLAGYIDVNGTNQSVARLNSNGTVDSSFNSGTAISSGVIYSLALQPDGKVLIAGESTAPFGTNTSRIARLNADGSLDNTFNAGTNYFAIYSLALQPDGKVLIGGTIAINGLYLGRIARLNADGSLDLSFNPGTVAAGRINSIALQSNGDVLIGGAFTTVNGVLRPNVARLYGDSGAPTLNIARSNAFVIISWPVTGLNFQLQENTDLSLPNSWSPVAQPAVTNSGQISVTVPTTVGPKFFRLKSQ